MPRSQQAAGTGERLSAQCNHAVTTAPEGFMRIRHGVMHVAPLAGSGAQTGLIGLLHNLHRRA